MKLLLLLFSSVIPLLSNAQTESSTPTGGYRTGLSKEELEHARQLYIDMMKSETYIEQDKCLKLLNEQTRGVEFPVIEEDAVKNLDDVREIYRIWLTENLKKTKFKSVEEGLDLNMKTFYLAEKKLNENVELFALMRRATFVQFKEIKEPERY